jgi:hypothetical protein
MNQSNKKNQKMRWFKTYWREIIVAGIGLVSILLFVFLGPFQCYKWFSDSDLASKFGDFIGGFIGTFLLLLSIVFLVATLRSQKEFFGQQQSQQEEFFARQQFHQRFFELLKMHRDNVNEIVLPATSAQRASKRHMVREESRGDKSGRRVFVVLVKEFNQVLRIEHDILEELNIVLTPEQRIDVAYLAFFYGVGKQSSKALQYMLRKYPPSLVSGLIERLEKSQSRVRALEQFSHKPFDGHQSRLGHYYRHLYQAVKFVDDADININHYEFVKTLRAQLSNHEQVLLFYNSLSCIGRKWKQEGLVGRYQMIKNIPKGFIDEQEIDPAIVYPEIDWEWKEC